MMVSVYATMKKDNFITDTILLYAFFWVICWGLKFICRCFVTLCLFHLHRQVVVCRMN